MSNFDTPSVSIGGFLGDAFPNEDLLSSKTTFCRIYDVSANSRTCSIKTFGGDQTVANADYVNIQWLSSYSNPEGDEISLIPRNGSIGICIFVGGTPWIIGFFQPTSVDDEQPIEDKELDGAEPAGGSAAVNKEKINMGDYIMRSLGGSRFVMRAGGEMELTATSACRRTYFPTQHRITELCHNFEQTTIGGNVTWGREKEDVEETLHRAAYFNDVSGTDKIIEYRGKVEKKDGDTIYMMLMGDGATVEGNKLNPTPKPVIKETIHTDGTHEYFLNDTDYYTGIAADGSFTKGVKDFAYYENIKADGSVTKNILNKYHETITPEGEITLVTGISEPEKQEGIPGEGGEGKFTLNIKPTGDVSLAINKKVEMTITNGGVVTIDSGSGKSIIKIDASGNVDIAASSKVTARAPLLDLKGDEVKLGASTSDVVPMGNLFLKAINKFIAIFNSHTHMVPQSSAGMNPSQPTSTTAQAIVGTAVLSSTVKVQG